MALLPLQPCRAPGCRALVRGQPRCDEHTVEREAERAERDDANRPSYRERGYSTAWDKLRRQVIDANPTCGICHVRPSKLVHHWNEVRTNPDLVLAPSNLVAICGTCHQQIHGSRRRAR